MSSFVGPHVDRNGSFTLELGAFYRSIFAQGEWAVYIIRIERDGTFIFEDANSRIAAMAQRPLEQVCGRAIQDALPPPVAECLESNLRRCVASGSSLTYLRGFDLPQGRMSWKTSLVPVDDDFGKLRHVVGITRDITFEEDMFMAAELNQALLNGLRVAVPSAIYVRNLKTTTIRFLGGAADAKRAAWRKKAEEAGPFAGALYTHPADLQKREEQFRKLATLRDGEVLATSIRVMGPDGEYLKISCRETVFSRDAEGRVEQVLGAAEDITEHEQTQDEMRELSDRMVTLQMEERRRLAEELHDSTAQHLTGASLALTRILSAGRGGTASEPFVTAAVGDALRSLGEAEREIRVLSYLFHPPLLDDIGFIEAIRIFTAGFAKRSRLKLELHIDEAANSIEPEAAHQLLRVCQEGLANVHRHARCNKVDVHVEVADRNISLRITDDGIGIDDHPNNVDRGIGLAGMRERMQRLNGSFEVRNWGGGTELVATVPKEPPPIADEATPPQRSGAAGS